VVVIIVVTMVIIITVVIIIGMVIIITVVIVIGMVIIITVVIYFDVVVEVTDHREQLDHTRAVRPTLAERNRPAAAAVIITIIIMIAVVIIAMVAVINPMIAIVVAGHHWNSRANRIHHARQPGGQCDQMSKLFRCGLRHAISSNPPATACRTRNTWPGRTLANHHLQ